MKKVYSKLLGYYRRFCWPLEKQARYAGVQIGRNNFIGSRFWSSESYLIKIWNCCAITRGVCFLLMAEVVWHETIILSLKSSDVSPLAIMYI